MTRRQQPTGADTETVPPEAVLWVATSDLYPALNRAGGSMPVPAYRPGMRVPWSEVERHGWHGQVRDSEADPEESPDSAAAARTVHPAIAEHLLQQQATETRDSTTEGDEEGTPPGEPDNTDTAEQDGPAMQKEA